MQRPYVLHPHNLAVPEDVSPVEDVPGLAAVGAGVHVDCAADGTGDAGRELETGQAAARGLVGEDRVENPGLGGYRAVLYLDGREGLGEPNGQAPDAAVAHQHVRPPAEHRDRDAVLAGLLHDLSKLFDVGGFQQGVGWAPYLPRRVALEGLVELGRREEPV